MYMLDTNICVNMIRKRSPHRERLLERYKKERRGDVVISAVTLAELEFGVWNSHDPEKSADALVELLSEVDVLPFGVYEAQEYGAVKAALKAKKTTVGPLDVMIAAHAKATKCVLVTNNTGEFVRVDGLKITDWT